MNQIDSTRATALLERHNPVELAELVSDEDMGTARAKIERLITATATNPVADLTTESRTDERRRSRRRRSVARVATVGGAFAAAAAIFVLAAGGGPATQSASAQTISKALRALQAPSGSVLHIDMTMTHASTGHPTYTWRQETYDELNSPWQELTIDRQYPGTPAGTAATNNELYDPNTNTLFAPPISPAPPQVQITPAQWAHMTPTQRKAVIALDESDRGRPFMSQYIQQLKTKLASRQARVHGEATIDGQQTIKITFPGSTEVDYVNRATYAPVETIEGTPTSSDGITTSVFHTFEYLPVAKNAGIFNLETSRPTAKLNTSLADYRAANNRLFPNG
ncbi:hypothetical protein AYO39_01145 [Actinobacteria bacterium SCGC AG-212-D09]|nr:hypothetical protein AYO39_01145 [Actinobacteria bacterium SCGC AG-212-D09]